MSFNRIQIFGYLGRDPELSYTPQGTAMCKFSVATTERRKNRESGDYEEQTTWFRCVAWGGAAERINEYFSKGSPIFVEGKMRVEEWTDREGAKRFSVEVNVSSWEFAGKSNDQQSNQSAQGNQGNQSGQAGAKTSGKQQQQRRGQQPPDEEIPF